MNEAMAALAVLHHKKVSNLEKELKDDEKSKRDAFQQERVRMAKLMLCLGGRPVLPICWRGNLGNEIQEI